MQREHSNHCSIVNFGWRKYADPHCYAFNISNSVTLKRSTLTERKKVGSGRVRERESKRVRKQESGTVRERESKRAREQESKRGRE